MESRNASFFENIFPCLIKETGSSSRLDEETVQDKRQRDDNDLHDERQDQIEEEEVKPRRSKMARTEKSSGPDFVSFMVENEPTSYREAVTSSEGHQWKEAIKSEIDSILQNHTWELVDLPPSCKPLGYKWIFKKKMKVDGTIDKYKARLVIKGFRQREGLDYFDTYSPVTQITSIRMILAIAALRNLEVHQMDVKTAFLNRDLEEEIYMNQPEGFVAPGQEGKVCRLVKSLYGLKQAPKQWHQKFDHTMLESGFKINECDKCVYVKDTSAGYRDDTIVEKTPMLNIDESDSGDGTRNYGGLKHVSSDKPPSIQAHAAMKLLQKSSSQLTLLESTLDSILPRLIDDTLEERLTDIFSDSVKNKFRTLLDNVIQENLPRYDELVELFQVLYVTRIHPPPPSQFLLLRGEERTVEPSNVKMNKSHFEDVLMLKFKMVTHANKVFLHVHGEPQTSGSSADTNPLAMLVHSDAKVEEPAAKKLKVMLDIPTHIPAPIPLNSMGPTMFNNMPYDQFNAQLFNSGHSHYTPIPPSRADKGKGITTPSNE
ncbi:retrotransposon protein, putative, ty1-copia subclass [Tanacetum coccineum]